jgi:hypothetical protein
VAEHVLDVGDRCPSTRRALADRVADQAFEAVQAIQAELEKILVIKRLDDLRERFPVRIEVTKTPRGSTFYAR